MNLDFILYKLIFINIFYNFYFYIYTISFFISKCCTIKNNLIHKKFTNILKLFYLQKYKYTITGLIQYKNKHYLTF